ncbi:hypothetical protein A2230_02605 [candidate division WOR-1 bacterium RIFOXYA2_FULL_36_21]|uniref:Uncharacterized protein n=1 Tax=candidate division WOR-1 bacterium RIFOXYB2_FULL_36_35 TaxID=1802578 RepID=A0A1F4RZE2_UNCSA|nr:MAG: hypothetical protein A2230_02605 [candidate division WOR-1 bacterium RIFOXYA2_FULL_36_21]OGC13531.1 MAG: hypothetical protein A2290_02305 [candidate division WOR-1 bacterium RIFOXYB2_FULL_36_35]OGC16837.1 MAG: hypothetical protein A2282_02435 [candidate division WOR-1 bacterium RIFOXYA12_FULL_36_13]
MTEEIAILRKDILKYFDKQNEIPGEKVKLSTSGLYYYAVFKYKQANPKRNCLICKIEIWVTETYKKIFEYLSDSTDNEDSAIWIKKNGTEYLLLPEFAGGYSVFDTTTYKLHSYYSTADPFIWTGIFPSPSVDKIAVNGCYWGCPDELRVFDTKNIISLPYKMIYQIINVTNEAAFEHWEDDNTMVICKNKKDIMRIGV